ncbi:MAG: nodulation protein NfeD [Phycisphaerales bacterium]
MTGLRSLFQHWRLGLFALLASVGFVVGPLGAQDPANATGEKAAATPAAVPAYRFAQTVVVIPIRGAIDLVTYRSVERRMSDAIDAGADAVVFELDTPGGLGDAALKICNLIKNSSVYTVAWIHHDAYSAGTFIALACNEIVMAPYATIGDCAPILPGLIPIPTAERAKIESVYLAEVVDSARRRGYDERLAMSFVAVDLELWLIENTETGDLIFVDREEYQTMFGGDPPASARARASAGVPVGEAGDILPFRSGAVIDEEIDPATMIEQRDREVEAQQTLPSERPEITELDPANFQLVESVIDGQSLLVVKTEKALRWGLAEAVIADDGELQNYFGATTLLRYEQNWSESLVQVLTSFPVRLGLIVIFAIGLLWEMASPGLGVPGGIAAGALLILLGAPLLAGLAQWWSIAFVLLGLTLVAVELFIIPGFGIPGMAGIVCLSIGFVGTFIAPDPGGGFFPTSPQGQQALLRGLTMLLFAGFTVGVTVYFAARHLGRIPGLNRLVLATTMVDEDRRAGSMIQAMAAPASTAPEVGDLGVAMTDLRPVGRARINDGVFDVVSGRGVVEAGGRVRVTAADRFRIVVEADDHDA